MFSLKKITSEQAKKIENSVKEAESLTSSEIVVAIKEFSGPYYSGVWKFAFFVSIILSSILWLSYLYINDFFNEMLTWKLAIKFYIVIILFLIILAEIVKRKSLFTNTLNVLFADKKEIEEEIHKKVYLMFLEKELFKTKNRNGVLIYISLKEKKVVILGDVGIKKKIPSGFFEKYVTKITSAMMTDKWIEKLTSIIVELGGELGKYFPLEENDKNELDDSIILN